MIDIARLQRPFPALSLGLTLLLSSTLLACGGSGNSGGGGGNVPAGATLDANGCIVLDIDPAQVSFRGKGTFWGEGIYATFDPKLDGGGYDMFVMRLREEQGYSQAPGTFALDEGDEGRFGTCNHCTMVLQDVWGDNVNVLNFQAEGQMTVEEVNVSTGESVGEIENVMLREIESTGFFQWGDFTGGGTCLSIAKLRWDTRAVDGATCTTPDACPNQKLQVCDPKNQQCTRAQCSKQDPSCPAGQECIVQNGSYGNGACYQSCTPFASGNCPAGSECVSSNYAADRGICKIIGDGTIGDGCKANDVTTGCQSGSVCQSLSPFHGRPKCYPQCDFFAANPGCTGDDLCALKFYRDKDFKLYCNDGQCHLGGTCRQFDADPATFGQSCGTPDAVCAVSAGAARGLCHSDGQCRKICRLGTSDCSGVGGSCQQMVHKSGTVVAGMGLCL